MIRTVRKKITKATADVKADHGNGPRRQCKYEIEWHGQRPRLNAPSAWNDPNRMNRMQGAPMRDVLACFKAGTEDHRDQDHEKTEKKYHLARSAQVRVFPQRHTPESRDRADAGQHQLTHAETHEQHAGRSVELRITL